LLACVDSAAHASPRVWVTLPGLLHRDDGVAGATLRIISKTSPGITINIKEAEMYRLGAYLATLTLGSPAIVMAEELGGYRGIGTLYFTFMGAILIYGVYDAFGKMAMYVGAPIIVIGLYLMLPAH
jgi:hypothetical protein